MHMQDISNDKNVMADISDVHVAPFLKPHCSSETEPNLHPTLVTSPNIDEDSSGLMGLSSPTCLLKYKETDHEYKPHQVLCHIISG
jgi:hypothetical protein